MPIDDARRPEPAPPQPGPVASDDGLTGNEFGRPPSPAEAGPEGREQAQADDVASEDVGVDPEDPATAGP